MDFRAGFITNQDNGLLEIFKEIKEAWRTDPVQAAADYPIEIRTIGVGLNDPKNVDENQMPAVFFHYGASRRIEAETVGAERESFTVIIEATVNKGETDFIDRSGRMRQLIDQIAQEARAISTGDGIALENVFVASATPYTNDLNEFVFIVFELMFIYEFMY